jgi:integrase
VALRRRRDRSDGWRPWATIMLLAHQGPRAHSALHLRWEDVDFVRGAITWRSRWDKMGKEWLSSMTLGGYSALVTAWWWRKRDGYQGPWVFYSSHEKRRSLGNDPGAVYREDSLWLALAKAERAAGIAHKPGRATHGFRRGVCGDILEHTHDAKLALDFIGDSDLRQAKRYLKVRDQRLIEAAAVIDRLSEPMTTPKPSPNRHPKKRARRPRFGTRWRGLSCGTGPAGIEPATPGFGDRCSTN